jgi:hypothetical protein
MRFRLTTPDGQVIEEGDGVAEMAAGTLVVSSEYGQPLRVAPTDVAALTEVAQPYGIRIVLREGPVLELTQLGRLRGQLLAELAQVRRDGVTKALLLTGVGTPEVFPGTVDDVDGELRLYDDALVTVPDRGEPDKLPYPFVTGVRTDVSGYRLTVDAIGRPPLAIGRLARRTSEFQNLLGERVRAAGGRTAAFLGALLPSLGALALRQVAGLLREGVAAAKSDLDAVDPTVWPVLTAASILPERAACLAELAGLGELWLGFAQMVSVQRPAVGVQPWRDSSAAPTFQHDFSSGGFGGGLGGMAAASVVAGGLGSSGLGFDGPFGAVGGLLAVRMLGTEGVGGEHVIKPRAGVSQGRLIPASTDYDALTAGGEAPTILAFAFCLTDSGRLVYEVLNERDHASYVYRADAPERVAELNRALTLIGYRVAAVYSDAQAAGSPYRLAAERLPALRLLRAAYLGRVVHTDGWAERLRAL